MSLLTRLTSFSEHQNEDQPGPPQTMAQSPYDDIYNMSGGSESDETESDDDSVTRDLDTIGTFRGLRFPSFTWKSSQTVPEDATQTISRREQLANLIEDLKSGFSLQSALDRFQTIRSVLESQIEETIENNVDDSDVEEDKGKDLEEPHVIKPAAEPKEIPLLDQVIIPQNKEPVRKKQKKSKKGSHHNHHHNHHHHHHHQRLATLPDTHKKDEVFLRKRIIKIRQLDISEDSKNRLVQKLMMGAHYDKVKFVDENGDELFQIDAKKEEGNEDDEEEEDDAEEDEEDDDASEDEDIVLVNDEDKQPTFHDEGDELIMGCPHYQRNNKMECPKCRRWFTCPKCHDEEISDHKLKRELTRHVMCMECFHVQEPSQFCDSCDAQFALYFCEKCKLYDNDENKDIYHCDDCGICRLGLGLGQDFFHCKGCNACLSIELQNEHKCIERATQSDCPICGEYMFTSTKPVVFMSCGHAIHQTCFDDHSKHSYKCPTCQKTVLNMEAQFRVLDMEISLQPLPQPYCQWTCIVTCNDCNAKSSSPYHVLGLKCDNCKSYNTVQLKLIKPEESDYESDISTTTNQLRTRLGSGRNLRTLPISSHLLGTNYNIESVESDIDDPSRVNVADGNNNNNGDAETRTLTISQQLMNNFDQYLQNMGASSSDDGDGDEQGEILDFSRLNRSFKASTAKLLSESAADDNDTTDIAAATTTATTTTTTTTSIANTLRGFLSMASIPTTNDDDNNENNDNNEEMNESDDDELNFNGF